MNGFRSHALRVVAGALLSLPKRTGKGDRLILAYHNVVPDNFSSRGESSLHLRVSDFETQLQYLCKNTTVVSLPEILSNELSGGPYVSITFDDAYFGAISGGFSVCRSLGVRPTVFVAPGLLGKIPAWDAKSELGQWTSDARADFLIEERGISAGYPPESFELICKSTP